MVTPMNHIEIIENDLFCCCKYNISSETIHSLHLQLRGVCVGGIDSPVRFNGTSMFKEIHLRLPSNEFKGVYAVPRKVPVVRSGDSPYTYRNNNLYFNNDIAVFNDKLVIEVPLPEKEKPRYLKGYSFPFIGTDDPYYELRINPKNTGKCPGRCVFCHRGFSYRMRPSLSKSIVPPDKIVNDIIKNYGQEVIAKVSHVSVITELFGNEDSFLSYLEDLKKILLRNGFKQEIDFRACSQDVRTTNGLKRLFSLIADKRYSYTLEVFSDRNHIMSGYKGVSQDKVDEILINARKIGFDEIKLNYVAGIDSLSSFETGIRRLKELDVVDTIGFSVLTTFYYDQLELRHDMAWSIDYYIKMIQIINELGIKFYEPNCFEMGPPLQLLNLLSPNKANSA